MKSERKPGLQSGYDRAGDIQLAKYDQKSSKS